MPALNTVLHVEDDADIQEIARLALEMVGGLQVHQFSAGQAAVAAAPSLSPDLILLDQMMPEMNGEETLAALREVPGYETLPVVFMSAQTHDSSAALVARTGAAGFISKPFDPMTLTDDIKALLKQG
ncbi:Response regulator receiver domain-containing protein [Roseivivax lentus]|uniref:Response regulator receiver domain-containing protein n=1 Tax=Roseivivax lentus TaxID=633194 RepID=A0A1N7P6I2_9RHOB|nr:response regulator [Roseivivax lentus]SIT06160.1 Response regulator receiver domain-containing protein [Roseivivax lentus]